MPLSSFTSPWWVYWCTLLPAALPHSPTDFHTTSPYVSYNCSWNSLEYLTHVSVSRIWGHTLSHTQLSSLRPIKTHTHICKVRLAAQCPALGGVPIPMAFPSTDNALCPTKEALIQTLGPCLALDGPPDPLRPPEPPRQNLQRCQEEHLCDWGEKTLQKFSHFEEGIFVCLRIPSVSVSQRALGDSVSR